MSTVRRTASAAVHRDRGPAPRRAIKAALPTLTDRAYDALEEMIVTLQLAPGSAASEAELSQWLGIGRTPIREALQRLSREKLVQILPRRGVIVSDINVKSQLRLLEVRREIDRLVSRSAARRATSAERGRFDAAASRLRRAADYTQMSPEEHKHSGRFTATGSHVHHAPCRTQIVPCRPQSQYCCNCKQRQSNAVDREPPQGIAP